jgi:hypothetical protein
MREYLSYFRDKSQQESGATAIQCERRVLLLLVVVVVNVERRLRHLEMSIYLNIEHTPLLHIQLSF